MKTWTIGTRIAVGFAVSALITATLSGFFLWRVRAISGAAQSIVANCLPGVYTIGEIEGSVKEAESRVFEHILHPEPAAMAEVERQIVASQKEVGQLYADYEKSIASAEDRRLFEILRATRPDYLRLRTQALELSRRGQKQEAFAFACTQLDPVYDRYMAEVRALVDLNRSNSDLYSASITAALSTARTGALVGGALAVIFAAGAAWLVTGTTNRALRRVAEAIGSGSDEVAAAAGQVTSASQSLATGSSEQAASLEETSASLEEMASMTRRNAESARQAKDLSTETRTSAEDGATRMEEMRRAMDAIKLSSNEVAKIIKTIDEIAFQTNILALNAAVEAARAGDAGMGFAVVAEEVRNLAQRSAQSARETAAKIEDAIQKSEHGVAISGNVAHALTDILEKARRMDALVAEIATASVEQNQGIGQINTAVAHMDKVTQSNASSAEESAAAAEELNAQAVTMQHSVAALRQLLDGVHAAASRLSAVASKPVAAAVPRPQGRSSSRPAEVSVSPKIEAGGTLHFL